MSKKESYERETEALLQPIVEANHVEIYDIEYVKEGADWYLRIFIDKEGGVAIQDCEAVSRALSDALDQKDFIPDAYILEVSSPGLGRQLKKEKHLAKSLGQKIDVKTYQNIEGSKEFTGILEAFDKESVTVAVDGREVVFQKSDIANIRLAYDF